MENNQYEVQEMANKDFPLAILVIAEAMKIIAELTNDTKEVENALDRLQGVVKNFLSGKTK